MQFVELMGTLSLALFGVAALLLQQSRRLPPAGSEERRLYGDYAWYKHTSVLRRAGDGFARAGMVALMATLPVGLLISWP